jgi:hypothetical protein
VAAGRLIDPAKMSAEPAVPDPEPVVREVVREVEIQVVRAPRSHEWARLLDDLTAAAESGRLYQRDIGATLAAIDAAYRAVLARTGVGRNR